MGACHVSTGAQLPHALPLAQTVTWDSTTRRAQQTAWHVALRLWKGTETMPRDRRGLRQLCTAQPFGWVARESGMHGSGAAHSINHTRCSSASVLQCQGLTHRRPAVQTRYTPEQGMGMLGLEQVQLFWERSLDTKVLIGWSADTVVISVRGTASLRNAIADIQVRS